ncbi:MAG: BrnT family toxin, partial [Bdellovibrionales bacterium]|nr:BrnT family toxin [Bdellovibrionales bacterium]
MKHGLTLVQIEDFLLSQPTLMNHETHSDVEPRYIAFGYHEDRFLFVVFT